MDKQLQAILEPTELGTDVRSGAVETGQQRKQVFYRFLAKIGWLYQRTLDRARLNLDDTVAAQTRSLQQSVDQLSQTKAELESANRELESFSFSVAHDLKAPLRNISGFAELLKKSAGPLNDQAAQYLSRISAEIRRMVSLIDGLLNLSHATRSEMVFAIFNPASLVEEICQELDMETRGREITWLIEELPDLKCDRRMVRQIFANLMHNAVKYTRPREHAVIQIGALPDERIDKQHVFFVRDNGVGFDMKYSSKLFNVFQRLHSAKHFEGSGIGLANAQRIVSRHGGQIWAEAAVDEGAVFYFSLPVAASNESGKSTHEAADSESAAFAGRI